MNPASATNASTQPCTQRKRGAVDIACALASELAAPDEDRFVADNFALLKASGLIEAGVPAELGGGDANVDALAEMLKILARHCIAPTVSNGDFAISRLLAITLCNLDRSLNIRAQWRLGYQWTISFDGSTRCRSGPS